MGEYATYKGQQIKIDTCESMYYLRAEQAHQVKPERGSVNPVTQAEHIRFRFPFPQEDGIEPGAFANFDYGLGVSGVDVPEGVEHYTLQFTRNYPSSGGILLSTPCPFSAAGKASGLKFTLNGFSGQVVIKQQKLVGGKLVLVCECGGCGAAYRLPELEDANDVIAALEKEAAHGDHQHRLAQERSKEKLTSRGDYYREVIRRIVAGYTEPNNWTRQQQPTPATVGA